MNRESDDDFRSPRPAIPFPAAPRRPEKKGSVQSIPVLPIVSSSASSFDIKEPGPSTTADTCTICSKNLAHLNELRKVAHVNKCLDAQESTSNHAKATEKWNNTIDCPLCGEPQPPGPHRAAHAKRCGKMHKIAPKELLRLMETQSRVTEVKKRSSMIHTKAPVPVKKEVVPLKLQGAPCSVFDENVQLAKALSASMSEDPLGVPQPTKEFTRIPDPNEKRRKRPRSYAIVELAPRSCRCEVLQKVHERFVEAFRVRKLNGEKESHSAICKQNSSRTSVFMQRQARLLEKLERLERLSEDLSVLVGSDVASDVEIVCEDGTLKAHRSLLRARTTLLNSSDSQTSTPSIKLKECQKVVSGWLHYVYSGKVEWQSEETDKIQGLAEQFGPDDLVPLCARMKPSVSADELASSASVAKPTPSLDSVTVEESSHESVSHTVPSTPSPESDVVVTPSPESDAVIPEALRVDLEEPGTCREKEDDSIDTEDPLQGIHLADSSVNSSADVECITVEDSDVSGSKEIQSAEDNLNIGRSGDGESTSRPKEEKSNESSTHPNDVEAMQITLFDVPEDFNNSSRPSRTSKSPDLFDERSKVAEDVVEDFSWNYTPLRSTINKSRRSSLAASRDQQLSFSSSRSKLAEHNCTPVCDGEVVEISSMNAITASDEKRTSASDDLNHGNGAYEDEYFNYHDPCLEEAWYEPVEMSQLSLSQSVEEPPENPLPSDMEKASARRGRKISVKESSFDTPGPVTRLQSMEGQETNENSFIVNRDAPNFVPPVAHSTPAEPVKKKARFGSNVKVLKTSGITPMPCYEGMTDEELKRELSKFGLKPMGRKRAVNMLRRIYDEVHPVIDPCTPTTRPLPVEKTVTSPQKGVRKAKARGKDLTTVSEDTAAVSLPTSSAENDAAPEEDPVDEDFMDLGDKTLNEPRDEPPEESMIDDTGILPKDLEGMTQIFLAWLRRPENDHLYNHMLSLQPVLIDELHLRMSRADSAVCGIPKKALANVLDRLSITFSLPQPPGGRRGMNKTNRKRK